MYLRVVALATVLLSTVLANAAEPSANPEVATPTYRITTAEVHLTLTAVQQQNRAMTNLSVSDFQVLRDGHAVNEIVSFESLENVPLSALVMTDISDSMLKGLPMERQATDWLKLNADASRDHLSFIDFGAEPESGRQRANPHLTSLYDALLETLPKLPSYGAGRRSLILFTDGEDNYSLHTLGDVISAAQRYDIAIYAITAHPSKKQSYRPDELQSLCEQTGGRYFDVRKLEQMTAAVEEIASELRHGYEIVFRPETSTAGLHEIAIRPRTKGLRIFCRSAYYQPLIAAGEIANLR